MPGYIRLLRKYISDGKLPGLHGIPNSPQKRNKPKVEYLQEHLREIFARGGFPTAIDAAAFGTAIKTSQTTGSLLRNVSVGHDGEDIGGCSG